jgi:hypothetical protein
MSFFKHVGVANNKKVIIIQRQLPGDESHMAAVVYSDILPTRYHDDIMAVLESPEGQNAWEFKDILQRRMSSTGDNMLQVLSQENLIKRVAQSAVMVKPNSKSSIKLDELVKILNEVGRGEAAVKKLEELDSQQGLSKDPAMTNAARNQAKMAAEIASESDAVHYPVNDQITDSTTANNKTVVAPDMTEIMMQMMQTMQDMQKKLDNMEKPASKSAAKKTTSKKTATT